MLPSQGWKSLIRHPGRMNHSLVTDGHTSSKSGACRSRRKNKIKYKIHHSQRTSVSGGKKTAVMELSTTGDFCSSEDIPPTWQALRPVNSWYFLRRGPTRFMRSGESPVVKPHLWVMLDEILRRRHVTLNQPWTAPNGQIDCLRHTATRPG